MRRRTFLQFCGLTALLPLPTGKEQEQQQFENGGLVFPFMFTNQKKKRNRTNSTQIVYFRKESIFWRLITLFTK